ncbi:MAG TPA: 2-polyprenyl-3-methyl-6-methoxy-1,4-benzoquinone monooxygenase [Rhodanobacteraceae bacterium]|nr:2-polyprenyl-3-methyl-6-methoxy-1,4-benzoquinone monooxygenase [Rhodanobacteraceae bacterium]
MRPEIRHFSALDRLLEGIDNALSTTLADAVPNRPSPARDLPGATLDDAERRHTAGLMRVNHTGEVCAQALYLGQSLLARDQATRDYLLAAAREENDHLAWCAERLTELDDRPSRLNPLWYAGAWTIGAVAAALSDRWSLGFVVETERQVEAHLGEHLDRLPPHDRRSRAVLTQMQTDEARHADNARARGGIDLPTPIPALMALASKLMKAVAYRV